LAVGANDALHLFHVGSGRDAWQIGKWGAFALAPDSQILATADVDGRAVLWDVVTHKELRRLPTSGLGMAHLMFSADGGTLLGCSVMNNRDGKIDSPICFWNVATGYRRRCGKIPSSPYAMSLSPDAKTLARAGSGHVVSLWEVQTGKERLHLAHSSMVSAVQFSPDGTLLVTAGLESPSGVRGGSFRIWDAHTGRLIAEQKGHRGPVTALAFSHDGKRLATGSWDTTILIWDVAALNASDAGRTGELTPAELETLWSDLAEQNATKAYRAMAMLISAPRRTLSFVRNRLGPAEARRWVGIEVPALDRMPDLLDRAFGPFDVVLVGG
jgi:WD40 repeat protein